MKRAITLYELLMIVSNDSDLADEVAPRRPSIYPDDLHGSNTRS
jgi:hypothetical protein